MTGATKKWCLFNDDYCHSCGADCVGSPPQAKMDAIPSDEIVAVPPLAPTVEVSEPFRCGLEIHLGFVPNPQDRRELKLFVPEDYRRQRIAEVRRGIPPLCFNCPKALLSCLGPRGIFINHSQGNFTFDRGQNYYE